MSIQHAIASYLTPHGLGSWGNYLEQIDRVTSHLGPRTRVLHARKMRGLYP